MLGISAAAVATQTTTYPVARPATNNGCLYLVATPIGNLEDITLRALRVLKEADLVACEDTRETAKLLGHYGLSKRLVSYHEHNEMVRAAEIMLELEEGARVALVSDAGMPGISDPGHHLVTLAIRHGISVVPIPGPTAFSAALVASGLPTERFHFVGFLPPKRVQRRKALKGLRAEGATLIFYEAPHRLAEALADMEAMLGDRATVLAREVTKLHEEFLRGRLSQLRREARQRRLKGEITILIAPSGPETEKRPTRREPSVLTHVERLRRQGLDLKAALKAVAKRLGLSRSEAYRRLQEEKTLAD